MRSYFNPFRICSSLTALILLFFTVKSTGQTSYTYTGNMQTYIVPSGVTQLQVEAWGASGANANDRLTTNSNGGNGSYAKGVLNVTPGQTLNIFVGGAGSTAGTGGYNGGGTAGTGSAGGSCSGGPAGGGGGASDIRVGGTALANRVIVAGGGGGAGRDYCNGTCQPCGCGGSGGHGDQNGIAAGNCGFAYPGTGVNFGAAGTLVSTNNFGPGDGGGLAGTSGTLGVGGSGAGGNYDIAGGGGGGGYYGGGGGGGAFSGNGVGGGGGGGGSSYVGGVTNTNIQQNINLGNGLVVITLLSPNFVTHPVNTTVCAGANAQFTVVANNTTSYQWQVSVNGGAGWSNMSNNTLYSGVTTTTLTITNATASMNTYQYRCIASGSNAPTATSNAAVLTVDKLPAITSQPVNTIVCNGGNTSISVSATGTGLYYQWEISTNGGSTWSNVSNTGIYSNASTATLNLTGVNTTHNTYQYRCVVGGTCAPSVTSNAITLTVNTQPVVTGHPSNTTVCVGTNAVFTASGTGIPLTYQWQGSLNGGTTWNNLTNNSNHSGVNTTTLTVVSTNPTNTYPLYRCKLTTGCAPDAFTNNATLTINQPIAIATHPVSKAICIGDNTSFSFSATGTGIAYQWQVSTNGGSTWSNVTNGTNYSGANTFNLSVLNAPVTFNNYRYRCLVSGTCPTSPTTNQATLTVNTPVTITSNPVTSTTICSGENASFTVGSTGTGRTYKWYTYNGTNWVQVTNGGNYSGATTATLNINSMTATGTTKTLMYYCDVTGTCNLKTTPVCTLTVHAKPTITTQPVNTSRCHGYTNVDFKVVANGSNLTYQWQLSTNGGSTWTNLTNTSLYSGATTAVLTISTVTDPMNTYRYRCIVGGSCPSVTSNAATLTVIPLVLPTISISASNTDICQGESVKFTAAIANGGSAPTYQWKKNNNNVATGSSYTTTTLADGDIITCELTSNANCATPFIVNSNALTVKVTQYVTSTISISSDVGTSWCTGKPIEFTATTTNEGSNPTYKWLVNGTDQMVNAPTLAFPSIGHGTTIKCELVSSMKCFTPNPAVSNTLTMTINQTTLSSIVIAPNPDTVVCEKAEVTLTSAFTNAGSLPRFQWVLNGADMPGETQGSLKTTVLQSGDIVNCRLISSNTCVFPELSNPIKFQVNPLLSPDVSLVTTYNGPNSYTFTAVPLNGGLNPIYVWYRNNKLVVGVSGDTYTVSDLERWEEISVAMASSEPCIDPLRTVVNSNTVTTSIGQLSENISELVLHPNPNTGHFTISGKLDSKMVGKEVIIRVTNAVGQVVLTKAQNQSGTQLTVPVTLDNSIANGIYAVNMSIDGMSANIRFVLNR